MKHIMQMNKADLKEAILKIDPDANLDSLKNAELRAILTRLPKEVEGPAIRNVPRETVKKVTKSPETLKQTICERRITLYQGNEPKTFNEGDVIPDGYTDSPKSHPHESR